MIKNSILTILLLATQISVSKACECIGRTLLDEVINSEQIYIGKIVNHESDIYDFYDIEVLKIYKGEIDLENVVRIKQGETNCDKLYFEMEKSYIFFQSEESISMCSRTKEFYFSKDINKLEKIYPKSRINQNLIYRLDELFKEKNNKLRLSDKSSIDIKDKTVIYFDGKNILNKNQLPQRQNELYPVQYNVIEKDLRINDCYFDYLIYVKIAHQEIIMTENLTNKLKHKIEKKTCR